MKIPKQIEIAGIVYDIEIVKPDDPKLDYGRQMGLQDPKSCSIFLEHRLNEQVEAQVFIHEITHAILDALQISDREIMLDERFVESFSQLLHQVIKQL